MTHLAYYNEIDPYAAQWLRNLIAAGHIMPGDVDERSIEDIKPYELIGYTQCHFFAGLGAWSLSLRRAGWPDSRPVWTGSCPCQPFSTAGKGAGFDDERHLWPSFWHLVSECKPAEILGEQVASKAVEPWIDLVHADMESLGYAFGCIPFPSAGVGAPHIRDRAYWVADSAGNRRGGEWSGGEIKKRYEPRPEQLRQLSHGLEGYSSTFGLDNNNNNNNNKRLEGYAGNGSAAGREGQERSIATSSVPRGMADNSNIGQLGMLARLPSDGRNAPRVESERLCDVSRLGHSDVSQPHGRASSGEQSLHGENNVIREDGSAGPVNGFWRNVDWLFCRDGKWRPVRPGTFPLATGARSRMGRLRAYGNAINVEAATKFIESYLNV